MTEETASTTPTTCTAPQISADDLIVNKQGAGVLMRTLVKGHGSAFPKKGDLCLIRFEGGLENGTIVASSKDQKSAFQFELGARHVLEGLEVAVEHMCIGQTVEVTIPPLYAYGHQGFPPRIPPRATVIFTVELLKITDGASRGASTT